jgi:cytochrome b6-f complex iron-sulfur subunit
MAEAARTRRSVLGSLILSLTGAAGLWRFLTPRRGQGARLEDELSVPESEVPVGGALVLPEKRCAIVRNGAELVALDLTCTHLGCTVTATPEGFACPCHGSRFSSEGEVLKGPAPQALKRLRIDRVGGTVRVLRS